MRRRLAAVLAAGSCAVAGCVFAPRTVTVYDPGCQIVTRQMVLDSQQVATIAHCRNEGCLTLLVAMGAVSAVSAVVSGSVVVVGNVVYWFEKRSQCRPAPTPGVPRGITARMVGRRSSALFRSDTAGLCFRGEP